MIGILPPSATFFFCLINQLVRITLSCACQGHQEPLRFADSQARVESISFSKNRCFFFSLLEYIICPQKWVIVHSDGHGPRNNRFISGHGPNHWHRGGGGGRGVWSSGRRHGGRRKQAQARARKHRRGRWATERRGTPYLLLLCCCCCSCCCRQSHRLTASWQIMTVGSVHWREWSNDRGR